MDAVETTDILLADRQAVFREAVRSALEAQPGMVVVAEAGSSDQTVAEAGRTRPDVVLLDADLPIEGLALACAAIKERSPESNVLVLAARESPEALLQAVEGGAIGYLAKDRPVSELIDATRATGQGDVRIPSHMLAGLLARLIGRLQQQRDVLQRLSRLTRREKEVLWLLVHGGDNETIARDLFISPETARTHIQHILSGLGVHSRLEAAVFVRQSGILEELGRRVRSKEDDHGGSSLVPA
jgi:DNA-binding NarL/FixJ family response regulator